MDKTQISKLLKLIYKENNFNYKDKEFLDVNIFKSEDIDSFQLMSIISDIEKKFKIKISEKFILNSSKNNTQGIIELICKKI